MSISLTVNSRVVGPPFSFIASSQSRGGLRPEEGLRPEIFWEKLANYKLIDFFSQAHFEKIYCFVPRCNIFREKYMNKFGIEKDYSKQR